MRSDILFTLVAMAVATGSGHPIPHDNGHDVPREIQYSDLAKLPPPPASLLPFPHPHNAPPPPPPTVFPPPPPPPSMWGYGSAFDHQWRGRESEHGANPADDIVSNIVSFLSHEVRSVPDVSSRVFEGIKGFLAHETRAINEDVPSDHPKHHVVKNILDFFASATK